MSFEDSWKDITDALSQNHVPEIFLVIIGLLVLFLAILYVKDKDSASYKGLYIISFIAAAITVVLLFTKALTMELGPMIILCIACFALLVRPFREAHLAAFFALFVLVVVYLALGGINGVSFLESFWAKFIIALIVAAIVFFLASFIESIVMGFGKLLNWWPLLMVIGILCIIEAALIATGNGSIISLITK